MGLPKTTWEMPLAQGLNTKPDPRALQAPALAVCKNVQFDEVGGLQKRYPCSSIGTSILGGGTISDVRRIEPYGDERVLFTKEAVYSWSARDSAWVSKGTYLAPKVTERPVFSNTSEQYSADRAELSNVVVYAWVQIVGSTSGVYCAAMDKTTGAVLVAPTQVTGGSSATRPKLIALTNKILLFWVKDPGAAPDLVAIAIDPANLSSSITAAATNVFTQVNGMNSYYDVVGLSTTAYLACRQTPTTSYDLISVTEALSVSRTTKARTCDGPIALSLAPNSTHLQVIRANGTNIQGDYVSISGPFTDITTGQAVGTGSGTINQIAAAHRSVTDSGQYRCYAFWSSTESSDDTSFDLKYNYVDTGGTIGTQATMVKRLGVASRAFDRNGKVFLWTVFAGESAVTSDMAETSGFRAALQNTYFLYKDDGSLIAKAAMNRAGGFSQATGHLPNVQSLGSETYAFCGIERRVISAGTKRSKYSDRGPRDIQVIFDSDEARRCTRLGRTLYVTGGQILQYDGVGLTEVGFHIFPWYFDSVDGGAGSIGAGDFTTKGTLRWHNAKAEQDRSTTASSDTVTIAASHKISVSMIPLHVTLKQGTRTAPAAEYWRTLADPIVDAPFYLGTSLDPSDTSNPNRYLANDPTASFLTTLDDDLADADMAKNEAFDEVGNVLERLAPPPATIIADTQDRLFLAGVSDNPYAVWYSRLRGDSEVASFHDTLVVEVPPSGGAITGLAFLNETLVVFCETSIWALPGDGYDNLGEGNNYGPARIISSDVGAVSHDAIALTPQGILFKSSKGWYQLGRGWDVQYVGGPVSSFDADTIAAIHVLETKHQVRILGSSSRMLVWDYLVGQWSEWTIADGVHAAIWDGTYHYASSSAVKAEQSTYSAVDYAIDVETAWIKLAGYMGFQRIWRLQVLGEYRSAHDLRIRVARDYSDSDSSGPTWVDDVYWSPEVTTVGGRLQARIGLAPPQQCEAIKVRITDYADGSTTNPPAGEALKLTALALEVGIKPRHLYRNLAPGAKT